MPTLPIQLRYYIVYPPFCIHNKNIGIEIIIIGLSALVSLPMGVLAFIAPYTKRTDAKPDRWIRCSYNIMYQEDDAVAITSSPYFFV